MRLLSRSLLLLFIVALLALSPGALAKDLGLDWLPKQQKPDGSWEGNAELSTPAVTGLAVLAYLGAGETHKHGRYKQVVKRGLRFLESAQDDEGWFAPPGAKRRLRDHAIATLAMAEAHALTGRPQLKRSAQDGIDLLLARRAGLAWGDLETTTWAVAACRSATLARLSVDPSHAPEVSAWLAGQKLEDTRSVAMATFAETLIGTAVHLGVPHLLKHLPVWDEEDPGSIDVLTWYFGTLALFRVGGDPWKRWSSALRPAVVDHMAKDGSWEPVGRWGKGAGRTAVTALLGMCQQVHYRYPKVFGVAGGRRFGSVPAPPPPFSTEEYDTVSDNGFRDPAREPLSTFSVDVDTASLSNVRRILLSGRLPPEGAVRIEEMINYFSYDYPQPEAGRPFSVTTEVAECPWAPGRRLVHVGLQGRRVAEEDLPPRNLVFLLDVSGSMTPANKLPLVKAAMRLLVTRLGKNDRVALVVYAGASGIVLRPTAGDRKAEILAAIGRLEAGGSTNGGVGIRLAYSLARKHFAKGAINRVILASDGDFNVGVTSRSDLHALIEMEREGGVFLTVLGVGTGNLKDSRMEMLADRGNGNYAYLDSLAEARKVLVSEAGGTLVTIAKDVKVQVEFNPNRVGAYRLIGYENRLLEARDFNDDRKDAGEIGAGHSVTALYEITPPGVDPAMAVDPLKYQRPSALSGDAFGNEILTVKLRYKEPDGERSRLVEVPVPDPGNVGIGAASTDFRFSAAVAALGMLLRESEHKGVATYALVRDLAHGALGEDPGGLRRGFMGLVATAERVAAADAR